MQVERLAVGLIRIGPAVHLLRQVTGVHELPTRLRAQLGHRADALLVVAGQVVADPERQRRAPVTLARQRPVDVVLQPLAEAAIPDMVGHPVDLLIVRQQALLERRRLDVPGRARIVEQRRVAAPAERIGVLVDPLLEHQPALGELLLDQRVGVLDEDAAPRPHRVDEAALRVHRHQRGQVELPPRLHVIGAERRRDVHQPRAILGADESAGDDVAVVIGDGQEGVERPIVPAQQLAALGSPQDFQGLGVAAEDLAYQRLRHPKLVVLVLDQDVVDLLTDRDRDVAGQRPRRGRPHQQIDARADRAAGT